MLESDFQKKLIEKLYSQGAWTFNIHGHKMQKSGVADILILHRRFNGFLELKVDKKKPSYIKKDVDKDVRKRYFPSFVARCVQLVPDERQLAHLWDGNHRITIENFEGEVLCRPAGLDKVLDCLQALAQQTRDWEKIPKISAEAFRNCRKGDVVYHAGKRFMCEGEM